MSHKCIVCGHTFMWMTDYYHHLIAHLEEIMEEAFRIRDQLGIHPHHVE